MKTRNKALLLALCVVALVAASVFGTLAYLTDTEEVKNTFTVGNVAITMDEALVDGNGKEITGDGAKRVATNTYKLLPGHDYDKDPTIHVAATSEDCWLFVKVVDEIAAIQDTTTVAAQMTANGWTKIESTDVYGRATTNKAGDNVKVFESFKIKGEVENNTLATYAGKTIVVTAYAIQADGFDSAAAAWTAAGTQAAKDNTATE